MPEVGTEAHGAEAHGAEAHGAEAHGAEARTRYQWITLTGTSPTSS